MSVNRGMGQKKTLITLESKYVSDTYIETLDRDTQRGKDQHEAFMADKYKLYDPIKKNFF